ncbi:Helicase PriA essential for oriC or DnaA-independent DNA replication [Streptomyces venezuelae]|uniref:primosomal protein N' n=1 Tax=Streptomyces gardneri TaxID=66892 RepID=UPI0006BD48C9|nr:primosomal protein N' [Streptomyces gardneri]ALO07062.1 Helicase PriA essential for oriC or DnaA-independent DNA replication [Streptomyces venezuelae]QPK44422.1 primosomal protein N' [Streptomyces gardneri]WRK35719.1 primosomal protein N' [Streptomyces venezuelae]CUM42633.1 Helicase PriA essential for oriC/DnaA-independent DNA replication [Streptomyces venezuelae]
MSSENENSDGPEQLALIRETVRKANVPRAKPRTWRGAALAKELPVARVVVNKGSLHLDQFFDYAVPEELDDIAKPGVRVRVRFGAGAHQVRNGRREGGRLIDGFLVERRATSDYSGPLAALADVVSPEPVLGPELLGLARAVADRYAGSLADVLQLAVPPRSARAEGRTSPEPLPPPKRPEPGSWTRYEQGAAFLDSLARGGAPRAVWNALPGPHWAEEIARAVAATLASGRGALVVVPDGRAAGRVDAALTEVLGDGRHALLTAEAGPEKRYARWLAVRRGSVRAVVGTRAAMFAPVRDLGLAVIWDDGDGSHSEPHAPQPHAREVLLLRAAHDRCAFLLGSTSCTVEAAQLVESGWAKALGAGREQVRRAAPLIRTVGDGELARDEAARAARLPSLAWQAVREGLKTGPVLVQVPRRGYVPRLACERCRTPARCRHCAGPLEAPEQQELRCGWCGRGAPDWHCVACGSNRLRAQIVGARRTAEELGRAFPAVPVRTSGRDHILDTVPGRPALVVSTPGAEPVAEGGYAAALLLDGWAMLGRPDLRAGEEALRRWIDAASLVRGQPEGGTVVVVAEPTLRPVQALVRWDPVGHAQRELAERAELGFPPVSRMAAVSGPPEAVEGFLAAAGLPGDAEVLGPVPLAVVRPGGPRRPGDPPPGEQWERALVRVPPGSGAALAAALKQARAAGLARGGGEPVRIRVDPPDIG